MTTLTWQPPPDMSWSGSLEVNLRYTRLRRISKSSPFSAHLSQTVLGVKHDDYACHLFGKLDSFIKIDECIPWVIQHNMLYPVGGACLRKIGSGGFRMFNCSNATNHFAAAMGLVIGSALCWVVVTKVNLAIPLSNTSSYNDDRFIRWVFVTCLSLGE